MAFPTYQVKDLVKDIKEETLLSTPKIAERIGVTKTAIYNILNGKYDTVRAHLVEDLCEEFNYTYEVRNGVPHFFKEGEDKKESDEQRQEEIYSIGQKDQKLLDILNDHNLDKPEDLNRLLKTILRLFNLDEFDSEVINNLYTFSSGFLAAKQYREND